MSVALALSCAMNYFFILISMATMMFTTASGGKIYGDKSTGSFACHNFHTDVFYCSGTDFFVTTPLLGIILLTIVTFGMNIIIPATGVYFLQQRIMRRMRNNESME